MPPRRAPSSSPRTMPDIELILFDVGGVLGTNGWDEQQRAAAVRRFQLDAEDFEYRHHDAFPSWEEGRLSMDEYLDMTVFYTARPFTREEFRDFMVAQSQPAPEALALAHALRSTGRYRMMTLNNESMELNQCRIERFGLLPLFDAFLTSCYFGVRKPTPSLYRHAFGVAHVDPPRTIFIDDRAQNLLPAKSYGVHTIHFTDVDSTRRELATLGVAVPTP